MEIYEPAEDSYFFEEFLDKFFREMGKKNLLDFKFLDMGTGSGILLRKASKFLKKENILGLDINEEAILKLKKEGLNSRKSNLFSSVGKDEKFDLITFNAPYLPEDFREPKDSRVATTGGKKGDEISIKFIESAKKFLRPNGKILLLVSSLTPLKELKKLGGEVMDKKKIDFEELIILEF